MSNIYLIRHGFTPANNANYNGQKGMRTIAEDKDMPLEKKYGRKQAEELGLFLNTIEGKTLILVSPYNRTRETLDIALSHMKGDYDIEVCDDIHEISAGIHYARTKSEVLELSKNAEKFYKEFEKNPYETKYIGGESYYDVRDRVKNISNKILSISKSNIYDNIFIVAHGEVNRWIYYNINNKLYDIKQKNCEVLLISDENVKSVFVPNTFVPKGYIINVDDYKNKN